MSEKASAMAEKTVEEVIDGKVFGNLSKLVPLVIGGAGVIIAVSVFYLNGGTHEAAQRAFELLGTAAALAGVGSATTYFGKSQTQLDLQAARAANTVPVSTEDGRSVGALPIDSTLVHGNYAVNRESETPADTSLGDDRSEAFAVYPIVEESEQPTLWQ